MLMREPDGAAPYKESLSEIDTQILALLARRDEISEHEPGVPSPELLNAWAAEYGLDARWLLGLFGFLHRKITHRAYVQPINLRTLVPIMRTEESGGIRLRLTHMEQYENCSVLHLDIEIADLATDLQLSHPMTTLSVAALGYEVYPQGGGGHGRAWHQSFVIAPALPDNLDGMEITVQWERDLAYRPVPVGGNGSVRFG